jgi:hypothetical protein
MGFNPGKAAANQEALHESRKPSHPCVGDSYRAKSGHRPRPKYSAAPNSAGSAKPRASLVNASIFAGNIRIGPINTRKKSLDE